MPTGDNQMSQENRVPINARPRISLAVEIAQAVVVNTPEEHRGRPIENTSNAQGVR